VRHLATRSSRPRQRLPQSLSVVRRSGYLISDQRTEACEVPWIGARPRAPLPATAVRFEFLFGGYRARSRVATARSAVDTVHFGRTTRRARSRLKLQRAAYRNIHGTGGFAITIDASCVAALRTTRTGRSSAKRRLQSMRPTSSLQILLECGSDTSTGRRPGRCLIDKLSSIWRLTVAGGTVNVGSVTTRAGRCAPAALSECAKTVCKRA
jgi:hypothetical protein